MCRPIRIKAGSGDFCPYHTHTCSRTVRHHCCRFNTLRSWCPLSWVPIRIRAPVFLYWIPTSSSDCGHRTALDEGHAHRSSCFWHRDVRTAFEQVRGEQRPERVARIVVRLIYFQICHHLTNPETAAANHSSDRVCSPTRFNMLWMSGIFWPWISGLDISMASWK